MEFKVLIHKVHKDTFGIIKNGCLWNEHSSPQLFNKDTAIEHVQKSLTEADIDKLNNFELTPIELTLSSKFNNIKTGYTYLKDLYEQVEEHGKIEINKNNFWWEPIAKLFKK